MTRITTGPRAAVHARAKRPERDSSNTLGPSRIGRRNRNLDHNSQTSPGEPSVSCDSRNRFVLWEIRGCGFAGIRPTVLYHRQFENVIQWN